MLESLQQLWRRLCPPGPVRPIVGDRRRSPTKPLWVAEEHFRQLVAGVQDYAIFLLDAEGHVLTWNAGAERMKGYRAEEIIGRSFETFYNEDAIARRWPQHELEAAREIGRFEDEGWRVRKDGSQFWANVVLTAVRDRASGEVVGFMKITRDLTERRAAEEQARATSEQLRAAQVDLERRVSERTAELAATNDALRSEVTRRVRLESELRVRLEDLAESDRRKDEFLALLAHELRNPLAPMRNALEMVWIAGSDEQVVARGTQILARQINHLVRLIDDLLDISRINRGKLQLKAEPMDLKETIERTAEASRPQFEKNGQQLTVSLDDEPLLMIGDRVRLEQVVANLLNNASKFTGQGGTVQLEARREGPQAVVVVKDNGVGIRPEMLGSVFDMFVQVDSSIERERGGLGIGLTLVRSLVTMHGGTVEARSEGPGLGSEFIIRLPVARPSERQASTERRIHATIPKVRILVVDDNRDAADSMEFILRAAGHEVLTVYGGSEAIAAALTFRPQVVFQDLAMPGMNGFQVAQELRRHFPEGELELVAVTGYGGTEERRKSREAGFSEHLTKPVDMARIEEILAHIGDRKHPAA